MSATTKEKPNYYSSEVGTIFNVSVPHHEQYLVDDLDDLQHLEMCKSRSQYVRKLIRKERDVSVQSFCRSTSRVATIYSQPRTVRICSRFSGCGFFLVR